MDTERRVIIQALKDGKGDHLLNEQIFRIAKNKVWSIQARQEAEYHYEHDQHSPKVHAEVWKYYSGSIFNAPYNSEDEALGYAGRSFILYHMKKFQASIRDIDRALKITKNNNVRVELLARKALCHAELDQQEKNVALEKAEYYLKKVDKFDEERKRLKTFVNRTKKNVEKIVPDLKETKIKKKAEIVAMLKKKETDDPLHYVDIRHNDKYGRHLVAKRDFQAGDIICVQKPYSMCSNTDFSPYAYCCHCMCISWDSIPCISCGWALFCSEKCRDKANRQYHDIECDVMPRVRDMVVPDVFKQLTIRTLVQAVKECGGLPKLKEEIEKIESCTNERTKGFSDSGKFDGSTFRSLYSLAHNVSEENLLLHVDDSLKVLFAFINCSSFFGNKKYKTISDLLKDEAMIFVGSLILRLIKIFNICYHGIFEDNIFCENGTRKEECIKIHCCYRGMTITPLFGLLNHSCIPNAKIDFTDASNVVLLALRPIKKNEQIFVTYVNSFFFVEKSKRQVQLAKNYNFKCDCKACHENWPPMEGMDEEKEVRLPDVSKSAKIGSGRLDDIKNLVHKSTHKEKHSVTLLQELSKVFPRVLKNFAEPSYLVCALMNAIERVSHNVYLTELINELR